MLTWNVILLIEETFSFSVFSIFFMVNIWDSDNPSEQQQKNASTFFFFLDYMKVFFEQACMLLDQAA